MKISLFLDFLKYICILSCMRGQNNKVILKFTKFLRYFQKKKNFKNFWGCPGPLGHQVALPLFLLSIKVKSLKSHCMKISY